MCFPRTERCRVQGLEPIRGFPNTLRKAGNQDPERALGLEGPELPQCKKCLEIPGRSMGASGGERGGV